MKKKYVFRKSIVWTLFLLLVMTTGMLSGCKEANPDPRGDGVLTIVSTSYAGYDFARQITRDVPDGQVNLILLGKPGQDMHGFEPTAADIVNLSCADVLICLGGPNEAWLDTTLKSAMNESVLRVAMTEVCETMESTPTEGMETNSLHDHDGHDHAAGESCGLIGADEHVWLSPNNAIAIVRAIGQALCEVDAGNQGTWSRATDTYVSELTALLDDYAVMMKTAVRKTILIADRYPFAYLVRDLGLTCYAAFPGCSSETSASFATQVFLIEKTRELSLPYIFIIDGSDGKVAEAVARETGASILTLDSCQVVTDRSQTYVSIMRKNLENLKKALC